MTKSISMIGGVKHVARLLVTMLLVGIGGNASAAIVDLDFTDLDFTDGFWSDVDGVQSATVVMSGVGEVTISAFGNWGTSAEIGWNNVDGLGVNQLGIPAGEIDALLGASQVLAFDFSAPVSINGSLEFLNLHTNVPTCLFCGATADEQAGWEVGFVGGSTFTGLTPATGAFANGYVSQDFVTPLQNVTSISFFADPATSHNDFSVAAIRGVSLMSGVEGASDGSSGVSTTPLPAAVWLFGSGLLALAAVGRRRNTTA